MGLGALAGIGLTGMFDTSAVADPAGPINSDWRRDLANAYIPEGTPFATRPLQDSLEVWEARKGYTVVDSQNQFVLESAEDSVGPFYGAHGTLSHLGPGQYYSSSDAQDSLNLFTGELHNAANIRSYSPDLASEYRTLAPAAIAAEEKAMVAESNAQMTQQGKIEASASSLPPVKPSEVSKRVTGYTGITGCTVLPNSTGRCGWVPGSILARYWHVRSAARKLIPSVYLSGTRLRTNPDFASYLMGSSGSGTWAKPVSDKLGTLAKDRGVGWASWWVAGNAAKGQIVNNNRPAIFFGETVNTQSIKILHAIAAYGVTKSGRYIAHFGWKGYAQVHVPFITAGSTAMFYLK